MYGVYSRAITKGRNNPDPNIEDLICVRSNQWCIRTRDSIKCKKLYTGLDRRILTCYNNVLYPGIAKLVSRLVWERVAPPSSRKILFPQSIDTPAIQAFLSQVEVVKKTA